jgi:hypothetical protein
LFFFGGGGAGPPRHPPTPDVLSDVPTLILLHNCPQRL